MRRRKPAGYILSMGAYEGTLGMQDMRFRRERRSARAPHGGGVFGFELTLAPSREGSKRYAIESIREIDRHTALEVLRTCSLAAAVLPKNILEEQAGAVEASAAARIAFVRLAPRQVLSMFDVVRGRDACVSELYSNLEEGNFGLIRDRARGSVIRTYAPDGAARGEGIVMELPHTRTDGTEAVFNVSIKDGMIGERKPREVKADYVITRGAQIVEAYAVRGGR
jgi:hypothetical protein